MLFFCIPQLVRYAGGVRMKQLQNLMLWSRCETPGGLCTGADMLIRQCLSHLHMQTGRSKTNVTKWDYSSDRKVCGYCELQFMEHLLLSWLLVGQDVPKEGFCCNGGENTGCSWCWEKGSSIFPINVFFP